VSAVIGNPVTTQNKTPCPRAPISRVRGRALIAERPTEQIRASPIWALGSYLACLAAKRALGHG